METSFLQSDVFASTFVIVALALDNDFRTFFKEFSTFLLLDLAMFF